MPRIAGRAGQRITRIMAVATVASAVLVVGGAPAMAVPGVQAGATGSAGGGPDDDHAGKDDDHAGGHGPLNIYGPANLYPTGYSPGYSGDNLVDLHRAFTCTTVGYGSYIGPGGLTSSALGC